MNGWRESDNIANSAGQRIRTSSPTEFVRVKGIKCFVLLKPQLQPQGPKLQHSHLWEVQYIALESGSFVMNRLSLRYTESEFNQNKKLI